MTLTKSIGFIGAGKMAEAIIKGVIASDFIPADRIYFYEPNADRANYMSTQYGIKAGLSNQDIAAHSEVLVVAVKPQQINSVLSDMSVAIRPEHLLISIAAGVTVERIKRLLKVPAKVIRTMPNTPCLIGYGMTAIAPDSLCQAEDLVIAFEIFNSLGRTLETLEANIDVVTAISGSGPAYVYELAEQFAQAGVNHHLSYDDALLLITQTLVGSAKMIELSGQSTQALIDMVSSPGGTTVAGLAVLQNGIMKDIVVQTVNAARNRAEELSRG